MVGNSLSHYTISAELGRGGMGIVYRAEDTKLDRTVAIKVLPSAALATDDDRARFYREAKAAAQLHHPNIASIFEIDEAVPSGAPHGTQPSPFIVMEFIEGQTLDERIQSGPLKLDETVRIAREVASALEAAHDKGIVHRDIKAANIILTAKGAAKVLDFGLAQTAQSTKLTRMGSTLGTVAYMSPEQARGEAVDLKTDLWSLGVVLYEMVSGRAPFPGDYEQAVVYEILNQEPEPLTAIRTGVPMELETVVSKCLAKNAEYRYPSAEALIVDLKRIEASSSIRTASSARLSTSSQAIHAPAAYSQAMASQAMASQAMTSATPEPSPRARLPWMFMAIGGACLLLAGFFFGKIVFKNEPVPRAVIKTRLNLPGAVSPLEATITPDDRFLFYVVTDSASGRRSLARYDFGTGLQSSVALTDYASSPTSSPDGRWIGFQRIDTRQWWRVPSSGGDPIEIPGAHSPDLITATFAPNGDFLFPDSSWSIAAVDRAGITRMVASSKPLGSDMDFVGPVSSPSGRFITWSDFPSFTPRDAWILRSGDSEPELLMTGVWIHTITASGHALFTRGDVRQPQQTVAKPIDLETGAFVGEEVAIGVRSAAVSPSGLLVYEELSNRDNNQVSDLYRITTAGRTEQLFALPGVASSNISVSADGSMLVVSARENENVDTDIYRVGLTNGISTRLTRGGYYDESTWGPGTEYVYFDYNDPDSAEIDWTIMRRRADGSGTNEPILPGSHEAADPSFSGDGRYLAYRDMRTRDIWGYDLVADSLFAIVVDAIPQSKPTISPDGRYVGYAQAGDNFCGSIQVSAVQSASEPIEIAANGCLPVWTRDGAYIYYQDLNSVSRVRVTTSPVFEILEPAEIVYRVAMTRSVGSPGALFFDVAGDGTLYVSHTDPGKSESSPLWVVHNWFDELNRLAPRSE